VIVAMIQTRNTQITVLPSPRVGNTGPVPHSAGKDTKSSSQKKLNVTDWLILFPFPVYLDVVELHSTAVRCC